MKLHSFSAAKSQLCSRSFVLWVGGGVPRCLVFRTALKNQKGGGIGFSLLLFRIFSV